MYTHGPLKKIMESCTGIFPSNIDYPGQQYYFNSSGYSGYQDYYPYGGRGAYEDVPRNYDTYTAGLSEEEQLERALRASLLDQGDLPDPGIKPRSPTFQGDALLSEPQGKPYVK
ncbi:hypothetical protein FD755_009088 [Muntiacus reevesi]|uniref:Uncharacterized protein n=1 Tax=Muntiacus reevesi TaxID=9886 RepID=A0A5J5MM23_MUNRE|nr:hypothetical protein FD755_009088 [Muntiacus reevesi]